MADNSTLVEDDSDGVPAPCAPCNKCAFTYHGENMSPIYTEGAWNTLDARGILAAFLWAY